MELKKMLPKNQEETANAVIKSLAANVDILGFGWRKLNCARRGSVSRSLNPDFKSLLTSTSPGDGWLSRSDWSDALKDIESNNKLTTRLFKTNNSASSQAGFAGSSGFNHFLGRGYASSRGKPASQFYKRTYSKKRERERTPITKIQEKPQVGDTKCCTNQWRKITNNAFMLSTISGYELEVQDCPPPSRLFKGKLSFSSSEKLAIDRKLF